MELKELSGVGSVTLEKLNKLGIFTLDDLCLNLPIGYRDYSLKADYHGENILIEALPLSNVLTRALSNRTNMQIFTALINNERVKMLAFGKKYLYSQIHKNKPVYIYGSFKPEYNYFLVDRVFTSKLPKEIEALYGLKDIKDGNYTKLLYEAFKMLKAPAERLPLELVEKYRLLGFSDYLLKAHFPTSYEDVAEVKRRKCYEKFFWYHLALNYLKNSRESLKKKPRSFDFKKVEEFINSLPFTLTTDQNAALDTILKEMASSKKINRLVEGDVGSGKTIVAFVAAYATILAGYQVAFIAPTEILARQHYLKALSLFKDLNVSLLVSKQTKKERNLILTELESGKTNLIIGTHAIIEDSVKFKDLGLVIIDEQQRFGVKERSKLQKKYPLADSLYFTATPIPRTLGLTMFGDLDLSIIKTMPTGRIPIKTKVITEAKLDKMCEFINERINNGEQAFIVLPIIEESESLNLWNMKSALAYFTPRIKGEIRAIHGKTKSSIKEETMESFKNKEFAVLLSTTMIEVGIDIPNSSVLVLMNAERFGLSSMHQLRGRIGRGSLKSYFFLVSNDLNNKRLEILESTSDGFLLANEDFKLRGPGDYLGEKQSGYFNIINEADLAYELKVLECAKKDALIEAKKIDKNNNEYIIKILDSLTSKALENN